MAAYDPQKARHRPMPSADEPAPVDIFLNSLEVATVLPEGVDIDVTPGGETILHTTDADIEITASGDDVVVSTHDSRVEVRAEDDEVIVEAAGEEIFVDTTPRPPFADADSPIVRASGDGRTRLIVIGAVVAAILALVLFRRRRR
jgi:hypothetical protein